jgi:predicted RNA binding protein YcfA (HicA-like mRNA interferase family)
VELREGGNHGVWKHPNLQKPTPVPRHNKLSPFVLKSIQKDIQLVAR